VIPGKATYYASAMPRAHGATPLVVTTFEGRPTKLGPNKLHPDAEGTDAFAQASVLDLYSPSRSRTVLKSGKAAKRADSMPPSRLSPPTRPRRSASSSGRTTARPAPA
jgi:hypothetical protein